MSGTKKLHKQPYPEAALFALCKYLVEIVPGSEYQDKNVHFIAHQPVSKKDRDTTKTRVVFDASAKDCEQQFCLNDYLEE